MTGSDVYELTAVTSVHGASLLADSRYDRSGVLSPASAFDPVGFLNDLSDHGLAWQTS